MNDLRTAAQQVLEALDSALGAVDGHYYDAVVPSANIAADALRTALAESERDWSLLEATQESLREHMAEIQQMRAVMAQPATIAEWWAAKQAASGEPVAWVRHDWSGTGQRSVSFDAPPDPKPVRDEVVNPIWTPLYAAPQPAPALQNIEQYRLQMAGICTAAIGYWKEGDGIHPDYDTPALRDVARLYAKYAALYEAAQPAPAPECDSPKLCAVNGACAGQYGTKKQCATAQPAPARVPLTDEQIDQITAEQWGRGLGAPYAAYRAYARAIEAAHGIAPDAQQEPMSNLHEPPK